MAIILRGDHELNEVKLEKLLGGRPFRMARKEEIVSLTGAHPGFLGPKGLKMKIIADKALENYPNFVIGANEDDYHFLNANLGETFKPDMVTDLREAKEGASV